MKNIWINETSFRKEVKRLLLLMKITLIILFICIFQLQAVSTYGQTAMLSVETKEVALEEIFKEIEKQSEFLFNYRDIDINHVKTRVNIKNGNIKDILSQALRNTDLSYSISDRHVTIFKTSTPKIEKKKKVISGNVKDERGDILLGVSILIKGTSQGTVTDVDGNYSIEVAEDQHVLVFTYLGYKTKEVSISGKTKLDVILMEDTQNLEEVVIVGYGAMKKENLTGAVSQLKGETLENRPVTNISQALQGTVANLNISSSGGGAPGSSQSLNIRGYSGFTIDDKGEISVSSQSPLIVIDGVQGGDINSVNMEDVESISVLKDAASTAIYGSSAPHGVVIINTKKGKKNSKATITYSNNFGFAQPINLPKMMNSLVFANLYNEAADHANVSHPFTDENIQRIKDYQDGKLQYETIKDPNKDEYLTWTGNGNNDWFDVFFKNVSFSQKHNIGLSGGTDKIHYYVGANYTQQGGLYEYGDDSFKRYSLRSNLSVQLTNWLSFNTRIAYIRSDSDSPNTYESKTGGYMHQIARKWPTAPLYNPDGIYSYPSDIRLMEEGGRDKTTKDQAAITGEFVIAPLEGWNITGNYTFDGDYINSSSHTKTLYRTAPSGASFLYAGTSPNGFSRTTKKYQHHIINLFSSYEKQLNDHYFKVTAGYIQELYDNLELYGSNNFLYSDDLPSLSLTYGTSPSTKDVASQLAIRGAFGRINYNYKGKYLFEFNGRYDGTSRFLKEVRYKFYPGLSAAWVISKENFWKPLEEYVNTLKLRISYASLGDQSFTSSYYPFYPTMSTTAPSGSNWIFPDGRLAYVKNPKLINPDLTWVTTTTIDFGADLTLLNNRLNVSFDWYKRSAKDFVGPSEVLPAIIGATLPPSNNAAMETKGFDLSIGWKDHIQNLNYGVNFVLSDYMSKITEYPNPTGLHTTWYKGKKIGEIWGYETAGYYTAETVGKGPDQSAIHANWTPGDIQYVDLNNDGKINWGDNTLSNPGDKKVIGNTTPRFSYGLNLNAAYKGFDFSIFFQGVAKRDAWVESNYFWGITGNQWTSSVFSIHEDRWTENNSAGYYPKYYMSGENNKNTQSQTKYIQNAAYMRIKNMQLGYSFPKHLISKINFEKLRIYASVENLATFTKMADTIDPEFSTSDGKLYPLQRTWSLGLNVTF